MKPRTVGIRLIVVLALALALVGTFAIYKRIARSAVVEVVTAEKGVIIQTISAVSASVQPRNEIVVAAERSGRLTGLPTRTGGRVDKGDVVGVIDDPVLELEISEEFITVERTRKTLERNRFLAEHEGIAPAESDAVIYDYKTAVARLATLQAKRGLLTIKAPISGTITAEHAQPGELIGASLNGNLYPGVLPIVTIATLDDLVVKAYVDEVDVLKVRVGQPAIITVEALGGKPLAGVVESIAPSPDAKDIGITYEVFVSFARPPKELLAGVRANVRFVVARKVGAIRVPREAVFTRGKGRYVFVAEGKNARLRAVATGISDAYNVEVLSGLTEGERVIVGFPANLRDRARIAVRKGLAG